MGFPQIQTLYQLILITWESAIPPCTCTIAALIVCARSVRVIPLFPPEK